MWISQVRDVAHPTKAMTIILRVVHTHGETRLQLYSFPFFFP